MRSGLPAQKLIAAGFHESAQVADDAEPADGPIAGSAVLLARHGRHVVDANRRGAMHIPTAADGMRHVGLPVVAKVDEKTFPCFPKCSMHS